MKAVVRPLEGTRSEGDLLKPSPGMMLGLGPTAPAKRARIWASIRSVLASLPVAFIKADGRDVSLPLERIDVSASEGRVAVLDEATGGWRTCPRWQLRTLAAVPGYVAALAAEGQDWRLALWQWPGESSNYPVRGRQSTGHSEGGRAL